MPRWFTMVRAKRAVSTYMWMESRSRSRSFAMVCLNGAPRTAATISIGSARTGNSYKGQIDDLRLTNPLSTPAEISAAKFS